MGLLFYDWNLFSSTRKKDKSRNRSDMPERVQICLKPISVEGESGLHSWFEWSLITSQIQEKLNSRKDNQSLLFWFGPLIGVYLTARTFPNMPCFFAPPACLISCGVKGYDSALSRRRSISESVRKPYQVVTSWCGYGWNFAKRVSCFLTLAICQNLLVSRHIHVITVFISCSCYVDGTWIITPACMKCVCCQCKIELVLEKSDNYNTKSIIVIL